MITNLVRLVKKHLGDDVICRFINDMIEESKYWSEAIKTEFKENFVMTNKDNENIKNASECWIFSKPSADNNVKVRDHCHITWKYRPAAHRNCNLTSNWISIMFHELKIMIYILLCKELISLVLEKCYTKWIRIFICFSLGNKLVFNDRFQFLRFSLNSLVRNLEESHFKYTSQKVIKDLSELIKQ